MDESKELFTCRNEVYSLFAVGNWLFTVYSRSVWVYDTRKYPAKKTAVIKNANNVLDIKLLDENTAVIKTAHQYIIYDISGNTELKRLSFDPSGYGQNTGFIIRDGKIHTTYNYPGQPLHDDCRYAIIDPTGGESVSITVTGADHNVQIYDPEIPETIGLVSLTDRYLFNTVTHTLTSDEHYERVFAVTHSYVINGISHNNGNISFTDVICSNIKTRHSYKLAQYEVHHADNKQLHKEAQRWLERLENDPHNPTLAAEYAEYIKTVRERTKNPTMLRQVKTYVYSRYAVLIYESVFTVYELLSGRQVLSVDAMDKLFEVCINNETVYYYAAGKVYEIDLRKIKELQ